MATGGDIVFHYGQHELFARLVAFERDPTARWFLVFVPRCWGKSIALAEYAANRTTRSVLFVGATTSCAELCARHVRTPHSVEHTYGTIKPV